MSSTPSTTRRLHGLGRILIALYGILALAATARSGYQILRKFNEAPVAFSLSAVSAVIYIIATVALIKRFDRLATVTITIELIGVIVVGVLSLAVSQWFPESTVWSEFGMGYGFVPLVLPVAGLWWLRASAKAAA